MKKSRIIKILLRVCMVLLLFFACLHLFLYLFIAEYLRPKVLPKEKAAINVSAIFDRIKYKNDFNYVIKEGIIGGGRDHNDYYLIKLEEAKLKSLKQHIMNLHGTEDIPNRIWEVYLSNRSSHSISLAPEWWPKNNSGIDIIDLRSVHVKNSEHSGLGYKFIFYEKNKFLYILFWTT